MKEPTIVIVDNTGGSRVDSVSSVFGTQIAAAIRCGGALPEELADLVTLTRVEVGAETRWVLNWIE